MKNKVIAFAILMSLTAAPLSAHAQEVHRAVFAVSSSRATGKEGAIVQVHVYPHAAGATTINFRPTGEKIRQISVGGTSLLVSSDDPDCLSSNAKGGSEACSATILYLQQKSGTAGKTRMTVLTDERLYLFEVVLTTGTPQYSIVEILPDSPSTSEQAVDRQRLATLERGFEAASQERYLLNPELNRRIRQFLSLARTGEALESAASEAGISMAVVRKLEELGKSNPSNNLIPWFDNLSPLKL
jgi:hypothetical protein